MKKNIIPLGLVATLATGRAISPKPAEWDENSSFALNIAQAAGIDGLKDQAMPAESLSPNFKKNAIDIGYIYSGYMNPPPGMTSMSSAGMGLAGFLFSPDARAARNSFFYWDENSKSKEEFYANFIAMMESAKKKYEENNGKYKIKSAYRAEEKSVVLTTLKPSWSMTLSGPGCQSKTTEWGCAIGFNLADVRESYPPKGKKALMHSDVSDSYRYTSYKICFINDDINKWECYYSDRKEINKGFNEFEFLTEFSKYLPDDFYIYVAPNKVLVDKEKPIKIPVVINKGTPNYFFSGRG